jgi:hypothetical protein
MGVLFKAAKIIGQCVEQLDFVVDFVYIHFEKHEYIAIIMVIMSQNILITAIGLWFVNVLNKDSMEPMVNNRGHWLGVRLPDDKLSGKFVMRHDGFAMADIDLFL